MHGTALTPAHHATAEHVNDEDHIDPALSGRDVVEVLDLQPVGAISSEPSIDPVKLAWHLGVSDGDALRTPCMPCWRISRSTVQRATTTAIAVELHPDLVGAIDLQVGMPHLLTPRRQLRITLSMQLTNGWLLLMCGVKSVRRWGDLQDAADRLDPKTARAAGRRTFSRLDAAVEFCASEKGRWPAATSC